MSYELRLQKTALRKTLIAQRQALKESYRSQADQAICEQLLQLPEYQAAQTVFTYVSVGEEVDTWAFIRSSLKAGKRICVPRCASFGAMDAIAISGTDDLVVGAYELLEPREGLALVEPAEIDLIVVPCLAATACGARIGYGGGFYDRWLAAQATRKTPAFSVALCRREFLLESLPCEAHDALLNRILTN